MAGPYYTKIPASTIGSGTYRGLYVVSSTYAVGDIVVPTVGYGVAAAKGYIYRCTTGGTTSGTEPTWVYTIPGTSTTTDTAVFTCENATTWAYASPRPDYIISNKLADAEIVYSENGTYPVSANTTITMPGIGAQWLSTSDTTNAPPTSLAAGALIDGSGTAGVVLTYNGKGYSYGCSFKSGGSTSAANIGICQTDASHLRCDETTFTIGNSNANSAVVIGVGSYSSRNRFITKNCTFVFGSTSQVIKPIATWTDYAGTFAATGSVPTALFKEGGGGDIDLIGSNLSTVTGTLFSGAPARHTSARLTKCKLGAAVAVLASSGTASDWDIYIYDSASGDTHYEFAHYHYLGNTTVSAAIYVSGIDGASYNAADAKHSWKITGINGTYETPYISPWISKYNEGTSAVTPRLEVMRDNNSTAYKDDEVWAEFTYKGTTGFTTATFNDSDKCAILTHNAGTAANQASSSLGAGDWVGETGTPWFGKLEPSATITPAEIGSIRARVCVTGANTIYINPKILGV